MENQKNTPLDKWTETKLIAARYVVDIQKLAVQLCEALPVESRKEFLKRYDEETAPSLSVRDIESGKADEILEGINVSRALIVAAFNADRVNKSKIE